jgi:crotonobetainyl-CoA:carnitine CoA-transferase CaiB-like acyl-CoA transferase
MASAEAVAAKIFTAADTMTDQTYAKRGNIVSVEDSELGGIRMPAVIPRFHREPGRVWRAGTTLGADNELVFGTWLGLSPGELDDLRKGGAI